MPIPDEQLHLKPGSYSATLVSITVREDGAIDTIYRIIDGEELGRRLHVTIEPTDFVVEEQPMCGDFPFYAKCEGNGRIPVPSKGTFATRMCRHYGKCPLTKGEKPVDHA